MSLRPLRPLLAGLVLAVACCLLPQLGRAADDSGALELRGMVVLMRHGVRPPTSTKAITPLAAQPWPHWDVPDGELTRHGRKAAAALGRWEREFLASRGLLGATGCPASNDVFVWANNALQRTIDTGDAMLDGMYPGCGLRAGHLAGREPDPLFTASETAVGALDQAQARSAIMARMGGSFDRPKQEAAPLLADLQAVLGCCSAELCAQLGKAAGCTFPDLPWQIETTAQGRSIDLRGPLGQGSTFVQVLLLEYAEGLPAADLGWGRAATAADVIRLSALRKLKYEYQERVPYIARRGASNIARQVLFALQNGAGVTGPNAEGPPPARLVLFVGSDTQIAELRTLLDAHWAPPSYLDDETPPGGGLGFELLRDSRSGAWFVRAVFLAQTLDQLRTAARLDGANPPGYVPVTLPGCAAGPEASCALRDFAALLTSRIDPTAVSAPSYQ